MLLLPRPARRVASLLHAFQASASRALHGNATNLGDAVTQLLKVPAYKGLAVPMKAGQLIKVINTHGHQVENGHVIICS